MRNLGPGPLRKQAGSHFIGTPSQEKQKRTWRNFFRLKKQGAPKREYVFPETEDEIKARKRSKAGLVATYGFIFAGTALAFYKLASLNPDNAADRQFSTDTINVVTTIKKEAPGDNSEKYASRQYMESIKKQIEQLAQPNYYVPSSGKTYFEVSNGLEQYAKKNAQKMNISVTVGPEGQVLKTNYQLLDDKTPLAPVLRSELNRLVGGSDTNLYVEPATINTGDSLKLWIGEKKTGSVPVFSKEEAYYLSPELFAKLKEENFTSIETRGSLFVSPAAGGLIFAGAVFNGNQMCDLATQQRFLEIIRTYASRTPFGGA